MDFLLSNNFERKWAKKCVSSKFHFLNILLFFLHRLDILLAWFDYNLDPTLTSRLGWGDQSRQPKFSSSKLDPPMQSSRFDWNKCRMGQTQDDVSQEETKSEMETHFETLPDICLPHFNSYTGNC